MKTSLIRQILFNKVNDMSKTYLEKQEELREQYKEDYIMEVYSLIEQHVIDKHLINGIVDIEWLNTTDYEPRVKNIVRRLTKQIKKKLNTLV